MIDETQEMAATIEETIGTAARDAGPDHLEVVVTADQDQDHVHLLVATVKEVIEIETIADLTTAETTGATSTAVRTETTDTTGIVMIEADVATAHHRSVVLLAIAAEHHLIRQRLNAETAAKSS
jgi:hypothetical protein